MLEKEKIAAICHEANRRYCIELGDHSVPPWDEAPEWQRNSAINGVEFHLQKHVTPRQSHDNWMKEKIEDGWVYGPLKDPNKKTHPCLVPYYDLPFEQRITDYIFKNIVDAFVSIELSEDK